MKNNSTLAISHKTMKTMTQSADARYGQLHPLRHYRITYRIRTGSLMTLTWASFDTKENSLRRFCQDKPYLIVVNCEEISR